MDHYNDPIYIHFFAIRFPILYWQTVIYNIDNFVSGGIFPNTIDVIRAAPRKHSYDIPVKYIYNIVMKEQVPHHTCPDQNISP